MLKPMSEWTDAQRAQYEYAGLLLDLESTIREDNEEEYWKVHDKLIDNMIDLLARIDALESEAKESTKDLLEIADKGKLLIEGSKEMRKYIGQLEKVIAAAEPFTAMSPSMLGIHITAKKSFRHKQHILEVALAKLEAK